MIMPIKTLTASAATFVMLTVATWAGTQPYAGQEGREIASLSGADVTALLAGEGWGLAKPAELNGYPGPAHVLELADKLHLTDAQRGEITAIFDGMKAEAQSLGAAYVEAEEHLSRMFRAGHADPDMLSRILADSSDTLAKLRAVHLSAHLETTPILTAHQKAMYQTLRGYGTGSDRSGHGGHSHD
ncbi:Spy/CpxP family protein refolding chaperone [Phaeobacter marinintestinus]|uniref:Spy/CpxP family protein refolding chaperone n=1 Tax=Falsiphaeobacter marinintestinus TaxID=1492905 RepID=UPI0011B56BD0|nr:Spy/CpxP family protein refolding chaperone [Phaeobacter marinintestinus]